jgi:hypothetical protein
VPLQGPFYFEFEHNVTIYYYYTSIVTTYNIAHVNYEKNMCMSIKMRRCRLGKYVHVDLYTDIFSIV